jgi:hypothetical protein
MDRSESTITNTLLLNFRSAGKHRTAKRLLLRSNPQAQGQTWICLMLTQGYRRFEWRQATAD